MKFNIVTIFKELYGSKDIPYHVPLEKIVDRIKKGSSKELIEKINKESNDEVKQKLKLKLPCILFSGTFSERNSNSLIEHSGLMITDFDYIPSESFSEMWNLIISNPHVVLAFRSPRGKGIKAVVKIPPCNKEKHKAHFKGFENEFNYDYFDRNIHNIDRVCFESYDPNLYYNPNAVIFNNLLIEDEGFSVKDKVPLLPIDNEDEIVNRLMKWWDKKFGFVNGQRNINLFTLACSFCEYGISQDYAEGYITNNIVIGDFTELEATKTIKSAYKRAEFGIKYFEDFEKVKKIKSSFKDKKKDEILKKFGIDESAYNGIKEEIHHDNFWFYTEEKKPKLKINSLAFKDFLERNGYKKYFPNDSDQPNFVFIESNKVIETSSDKIKDFVLQYLIDRGELEVWNYCSTSMLLFSDRYLTMLTTVELLMLKDNKTQSFVAYRNGILEVTKDYIKLNDYIDVDGYIWKNQIINRDFVYSENIENEYKKFIANVCNSVSIETVIGYLLSTYKNKMNNRAIILNDEVISENPEGGTGKGLFIQGIKQIRRIAILDGKSFDEKKSFPYQTVSKDTQILVFDDVKKNFDFESKFSLVTEGMTLERKNKDAIKLSVEESPKMVLSTNYAIKGEGNSHDRRRFEVEFAQYYGRTVTPYSEFGRQLFDGWSTEDFIAFDNYMIKCLQSYLQLGLIEQNAKNIKLRKFIAETSMEFNEWITDKDNFPINIRNDKSEMHEKFTKEYVDYFKLSRKVFHRWIEKYANYIGASFSDGNTQGKRWFMITDTKQLEDAPF